MTKKNDLDFLLEPRRQSSIAIFLILLKSFRVILSQAWPIFIALIFTACSDDSDSNGVQPINKVLNRQATGSSANNLLSDDTFTSMIIELVYIEGFEPTQQAIDNFTSFLSNRTFKPDGITIEKRAI